jgi:acyl-CoA thioester hydrolase
LTAFRYPLQVRYGECDMQGIVFNGNYLQYFDIAVTELWREAIGGWTEMTASDGVDAVVAEANVRYLEPLRMDDRFEVAASVAKLGETSIAIDFVIEREGDRCTEGRNRYVVIDAKTGAKARIPDSLREGLSRFSE